MKLRIALLSALLGLMSSAAFADNPPAGGSTPPPGKGGHCAQNPQECQQLAAKFDQWCSANADKCTAAKAHIERHLEWCQQNKDKCEKMMQRMHKHHGDQDEDKGGDDDDDTSSPPA